MEAVLEHAAQHRAGDDAVHLQVDDLAVAQPAGNRVGLELDAPRQPFDDGRLADAGLTDQHHGVRPLAVREDLEHLLNLVVAAEDGRNPVLPREQVEVGREVAQERRQLEPLAELLLAQLVIAHAGGDARHQRVGLDAVPADDGHRHRRRPRLSSKSATNRSDDSISLTAGAAGVVERELQHVLGRGGDARLAAVAAGRPCEVILERLDDLVRVQAEVAHDLREGVPLQLGERQEQVLARHLAVFAAPGFVDRPVDDPLGGFAYLALSDVEVVHGVDRLLDRTS